MSESIVIKHLRIYVLSRPHVRLEEISKFLDEEPSSWIESQNATDAENLVEFAGRICYMSFGAHQSPKTNAEYVQNLIEMGHESVLEHVNWTFLVTGVSRAFTHQLVRHRAGFAFSQLSQQYHDETEASFVLPPHLSKFPELLQEWRDTMTAAKRSYRRILGMLEDQEGSSGEQLSKKEARRSVLPNATETKIVMTANARALRHLLKVRGAIPGDEEMRQFSATLLALLKNDASALFYDFHTKTLPDGSPIVVKCASE